MTALEACAETADVATLAARADARTDELQSQRRIPEDLFRDAALGGLFRQLVPSELGGLGLKPIDWLRNGVEAARHEASFGWVVTQGSAELGWIAAGADTEWAKEVLSDPVAASASTLAGIGVMKMEAHGCRFGGRWAFNTGCNGATWIGGLALVDGQVDQAGLPVLLFGWVPAADAQILDDWDATGLRGTGSHTTVIDEQDIDPAWTFLPSAPTDNDRGPYRTAVGNGSWPLSTSVAATQLGNARRALDEASVLVATKAPPPSFKPLATNAAIQRQVVEADALWRAALGSVERELEAMWDEASQRGELSVETRTRVHGANALANRIAVQVVDMACEMTGTASVASGGVLNRCQRDAYALRGHISTNGASMEQNAKMRFGLPVTFLV